MWNQQHQSPAQMLLFPGEWRTILCALLVGVGVLSSTSAQPPLTAPSGREWSSPVVVSTTPYNLHLVTTEEFLNRFVARQETEPGVVDDFVFGAKVDGTQTTHRTVRLDLRPSAEVATGTIVLEGEVNTVTVGRTDQGAVQSIGRQQFRAFKDVFFDGQAFSTRHATVTARSQNQPVAASTQLDGTILARLGQKIALTRAHQQRPESEEYTRGRVVDRVYPAFDGSIDGQLADANIQLNQLRNRLDQARLLPVVQRTLTTESHLHYSARMAQAVEAAPVSTPGVSLASTNAIALYVHESLLNGLIDRLQLKGRKTTDRELRQMLDSIRQSVGAAPENDAPAGNSSPSGLPGMQGLLETAIEFDNEMPLTVRFDDGLMVVEIRAVIKPAGQALLPPLLISIPLQLVSRGSDWHLVRGPIGLQPTNGQPLPEVAAGLIRQSLEGDFPPVQFPRVLPIPNWPADKRPLMLTELRSADGWLAILVD